MKLKIFILQSFLYAILITTTLQAQTEVSGRVNGQWDLEGSPYTAVETIYISEQDRLVIDAGVVVLFDEESAFFVYGNLSTEGTVNDSIYFGPLNEEGNWLGLRFILANERSHLDFSILTNGRRFFDADHSDTLNQGGNLFSWLTDLTITNSRISNGIAIGFGGGFSILGGRADFENCTFDNNVSSTLGGAGNLDHNTESSFENCVFVQNQSEWGGGGINIYENSRVTIVKSSFVENEGAAGGGISLYGGNLLSEKCTFTRNRALMGGATYLRQDQNNPNLFHCDFVENVAEGELGGGAIMFRDGIDAEAAHCRFIKNHAQWGGGAISFAGRANAELHHNLYLKNTAGRVGGAIALNPNMGEQPLIVTHSTFLDNISEDGEHAAHIVYLPESASIYISSSILWSPRPHFSNDNNVVVVYSQTNEAFRGEGNSRENPEIFSLDSTWALLKGNSPCFDSGDPNLDDDPDGSRNDRGWQYLPHDAISGLEVGELAVRITEGDRVTQSMLFTNSTEAPIYVTPLDLWREGPREVMINLTNLINDNDIQAGIKINDGYLIAGGNSGNDPNKIYRLDEEFNLQRTFNQPGGVDGDGFLDMAAFNDEIIFAGDEELIIEFTIDGELGEQYEGPDAIEIHRALGVDVKYSDNGLNLYLGGDEGYILKTDDDFWEVGRTEVGDTILALGMKSNTRAAYIVTQPNQGQHVLIFSYSRQWQRCTSI